MPRTSNLHDDPMSLFDEAVAAAQGVFALLFGQRKAPDYFDFSTRGLLGSFVFLIVTISVPPYLSGAIATETVVIQPWQVVAAEIVIIGMQLLAASLLLRQMHRADAFVPYLVAGNWTAFYLGLASLLTAFLPGVGIIPLLVLVIAAVVILINTLRLVVTLSASQIVVFILAIMLANLIAVFAVAAFLPTEAIMGGPTT